MGIIELLVEQDLNKLKTKCMMSYIKLYKETCDCEKCNNELEIDFVFWNPLEDYNDVWNIVNLLEHFGYPSYDWDSVLYTFKLELENGTTISGNGLSFNQAVCNVLVEFANTFKTQ
jgi:hypothetical protein